MCHLCNLLDTAPRQPFHVELIGGPLDGQRMMIPPTPTGIPPCRWHVPIPPPPLAYWLTTATDASDAMLVPTTQFVYECYEAMRDSDHLWPYRYVGTF